MTLADLYLCGFVATFVLCLKDRILSCSAAVKKSGRRPTHFRALVLSLIILSFSYVQSAIWPVAMPILVLMAVFRKAKAV